MPRGRIGLPTPAFSGPRSTTELSRLNAFAILYTDSPKRKEKNTGKLGKYGKLLSHTGNNLHKNILGHLYVGEVVFTRRDPDPGGRLSQAD